MSMKKQYIKPMIKIESLVVSEFIAGNCIIDVGFGDTGASNPCGYKDPAFGESYILFNNRPTCTALWREPGDPDPGCYHIPDGGYGYFGS